jgi:hypothetical protein
MIDMSIYQYPSPMPPVIQGSRARGAATIGKDIDVMLLLDSKSFGKLASKQIARTYGRNRAKRISQVVNNRKLNAFGLDLSAEVRAATKDILPEGVSKVQFSVGLKGGPFDLKPNIVVPAQ